MKKVLVLTYILLIIGSGCKKDDVHDETTIYSEDFESKDNLDDWSIYTNCQGHITAHIGTHDGSRLMGIFSLSERYYGHSTFDYGQATKYISITSGEAIYKLSVKIDNPDDGSGRVTLQHLRSGNIIKSKYYGYGCGYLGTFIISDTLNVQSSDLIAIILAKGPGYNDGERSALFDDIKLTRKEY